MVRLGRSARRDRRAMPLTLVHRIAGIEGVLGRVDSARSHRLSRRRRALPTGGVSTARDRRGRRSGYSPVHGERRGNGGGNRARWSSSLRTEQRGRAGFAAAAGGSGPAVLVIQEWWGLVPHIRDVVDRFAAAGFTALAPDLFRGATTTEPDEAGKLMMSLNLAQAAKDLRGAIALPPGLRRRVLRGCGVIGFCMGGGLAMMVAAQEPGPSSMRPVLRAHPVGSGRARLVGASCTRPRPLRRARRVLRPRQGRRAGRQVARARQGRRAHACTQGSTTRSSTTTGPRCTRRTRPPQRWDATLDFFRSTVR